MHNHKILRTYGQFNLCHDNSDNSPVYYIENTILTKYTKGKGISYTFGKDKKDWLMTISDSEFLTSAKQRAGNDLNCEEVAKGIWQELGDVPVNEDGEIEEDWNTGIGKFFFEGTDREDIWHWFEDFFNLSVAKDLMGLA